MTIFRNIKLLLTALFKDHCTALLFYVLLLLLVYGYHGNLDLLKLILPQWSAPGCDPTTRTPILPWVPWDRELISFWGGAVLLVLLPCLILWKFGESPLSYGLALPRGPMRKNALALFLVLVLGSAIPFYVAAKDPSMRSLYPLYRPFTSPGQFALYELSYFPFFLVIEFVFRGLILFSVLRLLEQRDIGNAGPAAVVIAMLPYCVWHLGKPLTELWGTPVWGLVGGAGVYLTRSIWPVLAAHWLLNVWLDGLIFYHPVLHSL
ncbi:MAG TPA: CPBP family intramembrane glutamic endopeptidase [Puia sp.]|jgi:hypothetical protein|nr:CPBP family intramembrane glutamic endopeptidase [Puia sp.]